VQESAQYPKSDIIISMTWLEIRAHFIALHARSEAGVTQREIAERGGIKGQNSVSRLLANDKLGPSVETFVRAVEGLGLSVAQFFVGMEHAGSASTLAEPIAAAEEASATDRLHRIERALEALSIAFSSSPSPSSNRFASSGPAAQVSPGNRDERFTHGDSSLSHGVINHNHIATLDIQRVEAIVKATTESILTRLDQVDARMAALGARDGNVPTGPSAVRTGHFG
jgi:transcriptional regulator with XRE-family HTH domain